MWNTNDYTHSVLHRSNSRDLQRQAQQSRQAAQSLRYSRKTSLDLTRLDTWISTVKTAFNHVVAQISSPACQSTSCIPCCVAEA